MRDLIEFMASTKVMDLASDPRVLFVAAVIFIAAVIFRSKFVLLLMFAVCGMLAVIRYSNIDVSGNMDKQMFVFVGGTLAVAVVLIYFLFIRGD